MIYAMERRGVTEGGRGCAPSIAVDRGPSTNGCGANCAARGDLVEILAPSEPDGGEGAFEGLDGARFV